MMNRLLNIIVIILPIHSCAEGLSANGTSLNLSLPEASHSEQNNEKLPADAWGAERKLDDIKWEGVYWDLVEKQDRAKKVRAWHRTSGLIPHPDDEGMDNPEVLAEEDKN